MAAQVRRNSAPNFLPNKESPGFHTKTFDEIVEKLTYISRFMKDEQQSEDMSKIMEWCLEKLIVMKVPKVLKQMAADYDDNNLRKSLAVYASESSVNSEVAQHLASNYRSRSHSNIALNSNEPHIDEIKKVQDSISRLFLTEKESIQPEAFDALIKSNSCAISEKEMSQLCENLDKWGFDLIDFASKVSRPLTTATFCILKKRNLIASCGLNEEALVRFLIMAEDKYRSHVVYHNATHAADVVQSAHWLLKTDKLDSNFTKIEILAALIASAIHDVDHPGVMNQYLIKTSDPLAICYNDRSVLENHHLRVAFQLLLVAKNDFISSFNKEQRKYFREVMIEAVLATDMAMHIKVCAQLKVSVETYNFTSSDSRIDILKGLIHFADLSNPCKPLPVYKKWVKRINDEFWAQGDLEKAAGLDVSPMCDRDTANIPLSQVGFMEYIVQPLWSICYLLYGSDGDQVEDCIQGNLRFYKSEVPSNGPEKEKKKESTAAGGARFSVGVSADQTASAVPRPPRPIERSCIDFKTPIFFTVERADHPEVSWEAPASSSEEEGWEEEAEEGGAPCSFLDGKF